MIKIFSQKQKDEICKLYVEKFWFKKDIAKHMQCSVYKINNVLKEYNIKTRARRVNYSLKEDFFEEINSEEKAYILGLLFTDGSIISDKKRQTSIRLELKIDDIDILKQIKEILGISSKLTFCKHRNKTGTVSESVLLDIRSDKITKDLSKYGIVPNKTYKTKHLPIINQKYLAPFLRGLIDGDGSIYTNHSYNKKYNKYYDKKVIYFCNNYQSVCEDFRFLISVVLNKKDLPPVSKQKDGSRFTLTKQEDVKRVATFLYSESKIHLARKYKLAKDIFEGNNEEDIVYSDH